MAAPNVWREQNRGKSCHDLKPYANNGKFNIPVRVDKTKKEDFSSAYSTFRGKAHGSHHGFFECPTGRHGMVLVQYRLQAERRTECRIWDQKRHIWSRRRHRQVPRLPVRPDYEPANPNYSQYLQRSAVGTALAGGPPHRSVRAELPHTAPTSGVWRRSVRWDRDAGPWDSVSIGRRSARTEPSSSGGAGSGAVTRAARSGPPGTGTMRGS